MSLSPWALPFLPDLSEVPPKEEAFLPLPQGVLHVPCCLILVLQVASSQLPPSSPSILGFCRDHCLRVSALAPPPLQTCWGKDKLVSPLGANFLIYRIRGAVGKYNRDGGVPVVAQW